MLKLELSADNAEALKAQIIALAVLLSGSVVQAAELVGDQPANNGKPEKKQGPAKGKDKEIPTAPAPVETPAPAPQAEKPKGYSIEELRSFCKDAENGTDEGRAKIKDLIKSFGVTGVSDIPVEKHEAFKTAIQDLGKLLKESY